MPDKPGEGGNGSTTSVSDINDLTAAIRDAVRGGKGDGGGGEAINEVLMSDNFKYRERHREDQRTIEELREKVPSDDAIIISADRAKSLGIEKPEDVEKIATDLTKLREKDTTRERQTALQRAAEKLGWNADVMGRLPGMEEGRVEMRTERVKEDGETRTIEVPYIIPGGEDAAAERLEDYAKSQEAWEPFMPSLRKSDEDGAGSGGDSTGGNRTDGTPFPRQPAKGGKAGKNDPVDSFIEKQNQRAAAPNPLRPKARATSE